MATTKAKKTTAKAPVPDSELRLLTSLSALMRVKDAEMKDLAAKRQKELRRLAEGTDDRQKVSYRRLAEAMGVSEVWVYKIKRGTGPKLRSDELPENS